MVVDRVYQRSEGIPYFVEELTRSAARGCIDMPDTLRDALNVRVLALSDLAQQTLQLAAVAGNRVDHDLLEAVADQADLDLETGLREAIDAAVLTADSTGYSFRHALLREVVHDDLLPGRHARLHAQFAQMLEERPELVSADAAAPEIAHHWSAAHRTDKAFRWSVTAAESGSVAYPETLKMYERALELWDQVSEPEASVGPRAGLLARAARAAENAGEDERGLALAVAALAETPAETEPLARIELLILQARLVAGLLRPRSVEPLEEALRLLPADAPAKVRARVLDELAKRLMLSGRIAAGVEVSRQAIASAVEAGSAAVESNARTTLGTGLAAIGLERDGLEEFEKAGRLTPVDSRSSIRYFVNHSDGLHLAGEFQRAVDQALAGVEVARRLGLERSSGAMLAGNAAEPLMALGEWTRAAAIIERALELDPPAHHRTHLRLLQAWLNVWRGRLEEAEAVLAGFGAVIHGEQPSPQYASYAIRTDMDYALAIGDADRAWSDATVYLDRWDTYHAAQAYPVLAPGAAAARILDQRDGSRGRVALVREAYERRAAAIAIRSAWAPLIEAELTDDLSGWRTAVQRLGSPSAPAHLLPYAGLQLGRHLVAARERAEARSVLTSAAERALALGATLLTDRIAGLSQKAGLGGGPAFGASYAEPSPVAALTARELEVLELVAAGRSNGEIGAALFISTKTASVHVSNILAKLGVGGRGEAAAIAHRSGIGG